MLKALVALLALTLVACGGATNGAPTGTPEPKIAFTSVRGALPGGLATVEIKGPPDTRCGIQFTTPTGELSQAAGLREATTKPDGTAAWQWKVEEYATPGVGTVTVFCGLIQGMTTLPIGRP
jgi:hypothetical protein